jgi:folylpolyglutamate synthase/dihydropteroate synthase
MQYAAIEEYLEKLQGENSKLSLDNIGLIIANLPFAVGSVKYIQVAGTNGKVRPPISSPPSCAPPAGG